MNNVPDDAVVAKRQKLPPVVQRYKSFVNVVRCLVKRLTISSTLRFYTATFSSDYFFQTLENIQPYLTYDSYSFFLSRSHRLYPTR
jgi:hypothetical protein